MQLAFVEISNYRGIRSLRLPFDETTTLIGENAYGKSNLLDALLVCLGVGAPEGQFAFQPGDFRVVGDGFSPENELAQARCEPIEIMLGFRESDESEWDRDAAFASLRPHVDLSEPGERRVRVLVRAELGAATDGADRAISVCTSFVDREHDVVGRACNDEILALLRQRVPFVMLKADRYFVRPSRAPSLPAKGTSPVDVESRLAAEVTEAFGHVADMHKPVDERWVAHGLEAAERYLHRFGGERLKRRLSHFFDSRTTTSGATGVSGGARSIALLLIFGSLFDARIERTFGHGARPILAIEDAEAYLHPVILASVAALIEAIPTQKILTTNSGDLISMLRLTSLRRLVRRSTHTEVHRVTPEDYSGDEIRRIGYHVRAMRGASLFARSWLLVEGETEFWLLPELAAVAGYDFALEGVRMMEFAQCGVEPLIKLADDLGIAWHLVADGDRSGESYANAASDLLAGRSEEDHITRLPKRDIEHLLWSSGYADVYRNAISSSAPRRLDRGKRVENPTPTIERAIRARSKPGMAMRIVDAANEPNSPGVPEAILHTIERTVALARRVSN